MRVRPHEGAAPSAFGWPRSEPVPASVAVSEGVRGRCGPAGTHPGSPAASRPARRLQRLTSSFFTSAVPPVAARTQ